MMRSRRNMVLKIVIAASVIVAVAVFWRTAAFDGARRVLYRVVSPLARSVRLVVPEEDAARLAQLEAENRALGEEVAELRRALGFSEAAAVPLTGARVVAYGRDALGEMLLIDRNDGDLPAGAVVIDADGRLIGTIVSSEHAYAKIAVASNAGTSFEVDLPASGARALLKGLGGRTLAVELVPVGLSARAGDDVMLAVSGRRDLIIRAADIVAVREDRNSAFQEIRATLSARPERSRRVFIVQTVAVSP